MDELNPNCIAAWAVPCQWDAETIAFAQGVAAEIDSGAARRERFANALRELYQGADTSWGGGTWREFVGEGERGVVLLLALAATPRIQVVHAAQGVPREITDGVCWDACISVHRCRVAFGEIGIERFLLPWFRLIADGGLYRVGRLEYEPMAYDGGIRALRHRTTGEIVALAADGMRFGRDDLPVIGDETAKGEYRASQIVGEDVITGNPVTPVGRATAETRRLPLSEWEILLQPGDDVLNLHIPGSGPLTVAETRESLLAAREFFQTLRPEKRYKAFVCGSWLLNPDLETMLPPETNMVKFLRQGYSYPIYSDGRDGLYFVYCKHNVDPATAPRDTRLRRAMMERLDAGLPLRAGGMFFLTGDAERWGEEPYRRE